MTNNKNEKANIKCLAIDQYVTSNIIEPVEKIIKDKSFVAWGEMNNYPDYIEDLYQNVSTLHSIIDGITDYICGEGIEANLPSFFHYTNKKGISIDELITYIAKDLVKYNGFALNILKSKTGEISEIHYIDFKRVRSNKEGTKFYYSTEWNKSFGRSKYIEYNSFFSNEENNFSTILYYKNDVNKIYPTPMFGASVISCEIEKRINDYHLNNIVNSFSSNYIINFNNGKPSDEIQEEIEEEVNDKFCGSENAGRPMLSFNNGKENETTVTKIDVDSFADKYNALTERTKQDIFTAFRCSPILFGIDQEKTGFNANEYAETFRLFNKTVVEPFQNKIIKVFEKIFETKNVIKIIPFKINFDKEINA